MRTQRRPAQPTPTPENTEAPAGEERGSTLEAGADHAAPEENPQASETEKELQRVEKLSLDMHKAGTTAQDAEVNKQRAGSGHVNWDEVRRVREQAEQRVKTNSVISRGPGYYVDSPITTSNEIGERLELPKGFKLPEYLVNRFRTKRDKKGRSELDRLIAEGVIEDFAGSSVS